MVGGEARVPGDPARAVCSVHTVTSVCWTEIHLPDMCYICIRNLCMLPSVRFATANTAPGTVWWCIWVAIIGRRILPLACPVLCRQHGKGEETWKEGTQINLIWGLNISIFCVWSATTTVASDDFSAWDKNGRDHFVHNYFSRWLTKPKMWTKSSFCLSTFPTSLWLLFLCLFSSTTLMGPFH